MTKGTYYKLRTKKWLEDKGYAVALLERIQRIITKDKVLFLKRDIFGADLVAMKKDEIIFINAVFGKKNVARNIKKFHQYPYPSFVKKWIVVWQKRAREPEIVEC